MNKNKENLEKLLVFIEELCKKKENEWFRDRLELIINENDSTIIKTYKNTDRIKEYLSIVPDSSIDYSFIMNKTVRVRLDLDNLRMENVYIDFQKKYNDDIHRWYDYLVYAFYQIENLINYYYFKKYPDFDKLILHLESIPDTNFTRNNKFENISDIPIATKIYSFSKTFFEKDPVGYILSNITNVRNEGVHRCSSILRNNEENEKLFKFLKKQSYPEVRNALFKLAEKIKINL